METTRTKKEQTKEKKRKGKRKRRDTKKNRKQNRKTSSSPSISLSFPFSLVSYWLWRIALIGLLEVFHCGFTLSRIAGTVCDKQPIVTFRGNIVVPRNNLTKKGNTNHKNSKNGKRIQYCMSCLIWKIFLNFFSSLFVLFRLFTFTLTPRRRKHRSWLSFIPQSTIRISLSPLPYDFASFVET